MEPRRDEELHLPLEILPQQDITPLRSAREFVDLRPVGDLVIHENRNAVEPAHRELAVNHPSRASAQDRLQARNGEIASASRLAGDSRPHASHLGQSPVDLPRPLMGAIYPAKPCAAAWITDMRVSKSIASHHPTPAIVEFCILRNRFTVSTMKLGAAIRAIARIEEAGEKQ